MKNLPKILKVVGIIANVKKVSCSEYVREIVKLLSDKGLDIIIETKTADFAGIDTRTSGDIREIARKSDILFVLGGDGTILRIARETAGIKIPLVGINLGKLGFITTAPSEELQITIDKILNRKATVESRPLIEATGTPFIKKQLALNDFVISRGATSRMIDLEVKVNGIYLTRYRCDGLIVCSPTGSTAYSLSAGGAIVSPDAHVFTITPICPHTLTNRSVIVSLNSIIEIKFLSEKVSAFVFSDGQIEHPLKEGDNVLIKKSRYSSYLVHLEGDTFFKTLRHKLNWSGSNIQ
ncbi:MAG: NAD(+)/NADH kinase [Verrucomicrobiia bacterium]